MTVMVFLASTATITMAEEIFEDIDCYNEQPSSFGGFEIDTNLHQIGFLFNKNKEKKKKKKKKITKPPGEPKDIFDEALNYHEWYLEE